MKLLIRLPGAFLLGWCVLFLSWGTHTQAQDFLDPEVAFKFTSRAIDANTLEVRGFIGVSLFGRTDVWKRQVKK